MRVYRVTVYRSTGPAGTLVVLAPDRRKAMEVADRLHPDATSLGVWRIW
jgi:hypothetical protein